MPEDFKITQPAITPLYQDHDEQPKVSPEEETLVEATMQTEEQPSTGRQFLDKFIGFFYEEVPQSHEETDEDGNTVTVDDEPKKQINWFKVGACSTSVTLMLIGALVMLNRKHR